MIPTFFRYLLEHVVRGMGSVREAICGHREYPDTLMSDIKRVIEDRTTVLLEYVKQVQTISHNSIHDQIQATEQQINEHTSKVHRDDTPTSVQITQLQDNMDNIIRTVNTTETKIASLSFNIEKLRKSIADATDDVRSFDLRRR
jgi:predicted  nucleic acid-binding Zn-ribbon protein